MTKRFIAASVGLCLTLGLAGASTKDINLQSLSYKSVSLNSAVNDGKYTLVMIWSTDCVACEVQKPMVQSFFDDYRDSKATVVGIAHDGMSKVDKISELIDKNKPTYPNFVASPDTFFSEFEIATGKKFRATPTYIMYDPTGNILGVAVGQIKRETLDNIVSN